MSNLENHITPYSKVVVKLLKSSIIEKSNDILWSDIINYQTEVQEYISLLGLELIVKKDEGFAYVKQFTLSDDTTLGLVSRRQVGFETSIVLVVLRQSIEDFDSNPTQLANDKFITDTEIKEELELFLPEGYNTLKFQKDLDKYIQSVVDLGYLKVINKRDNETKYKIHRIIKEKITLDVLSDFKTKLDEYVESI